MRPRRVLAGAALVALAFVSMPAQGQDAPRLGVPVACPADAGCLVRSFVDRDPGPGAADWRCGPLAYDGHKGTDIRVPDGAAMARGVQVLAAAPGRVLRLRDGMDDVSIRTAGAGSVKGREAGNSLILEHGGGWETQYSHLRKGSIAVTPGETVAAGQPLALVGLSGNTEFTHLHFEVRHDGVAIDPYTGAAMGEGCGQAGAPLWTGAALATLAYRDAAVFDAGFADGRADPWIARAGGYAAFAPEAGTPALVFWIDVLGRRTGDRQSMRLIGPDGGILAEAQDAADETRVQWFQFIGKKRPDSGWPPGAYRGTYTLTRIVEGQPAVVLAVERSIDLR